jgi:hypothetical protein
MSYRCINDFWIECTDTERWDKEHAEVAKREANNASCMMFYKCTLDKNTCGFNKSLQQAKSNEALVIITEKPKEISKTKPTKFLEENPWDKNTKKEDEMNPSLFPKKEYNEWNNEWQNMPEFNQKIQSSYAQVNVRFATEEDLKNFNNIIGCKLSKKSTSMWFPPIDGSINSYSINNTKRYIDE